MFNWFSQKKFHQWYEIGQDWRGSIGNFKGMNDITEYIFECENCKEVRKVYSPLDMSTINSKRGCKG